MQNKIFSFLLLIFSVGLLNAAAQETGQISKSTTPVISGGVLNGKATNLVKPSYPAAARAVRAEGAVNVQVTIDEEGNVISANAVSGHPLLRSSAVEAARASKFSPTTLSGAAVKVTGVIVYNFISDKSPNYEERLKIMGLGTFLVMARLDKMFTEDEDLARDTPAEFSKLASELTPLKNLKTMSKQEREQTLDQITDAVKFKLTGSDANEFEIGTLFGQILVEIYQAKEEKSVELSENSIKNKLLNLKSLINLLAPDFPAEVSTQFSSLADLSDKPNLTSDANLQNLINRTMRIIETISPDKPASKQK